MRARYGFATAALCILAVAGAAAHADPVTDQINQALAAYGKKDLRGAAGALDAAATLIRQQEATQWKAVLPAALPGWTATQAEGNAVAPALFGGVVTVSRKYQKDGAIVTVSIVAHSPMVQVMANFLSSGLGAMIGGAELAVIDGHRTLHSKSENSYQTLVGHAVLVKVQGNAAVDDAALRQYLHAVDFAAVQRLAS
ncbi:MAG: hypothetical protein ACREE4_19215 [Stellaceae bacterium]